MSLTVVVLLFAVLHILGTSCFGMPMPSSSIASILPRYSDGSTTFNKAGCEQLGVSCWLVAHGDCYQSKRLGLTQGREDWLPVAGVTAKSTPNGFSLNLTSIPGHIALNSAPTSSIYLKSYSVLNL